jgi:hypothetical protein
VKNGIVALDDDTVLAQVAAHGTRVGADDRHIFTTRASTKTA